MKSYDLIIVGAGPAGMSAAIAASEEDIKILLLDGSDKIGKKILVTGNGKCNLTNSYQDIACYRTETPDKVLGVLNLFGPSKTAGFFRDLGILTRDKNGYIYPYNEQASTVRDAFESFIRGNKNITVRTGCHVDKILPLREGFRIITGTGNYVSTAVILTTGGYAGPGNDSDGTGFGLAGCMGHRLIPTYPALTALKSSAPFLKKVRGVRNRANISLLIDEEPLYSESGELQWTDYGISGVAVFQLSRYAVIALEEGRSVSLSLDFLREMDRNQLYEYLYSQIRNCSYKDAGEILKGFLPEKLTPVVLREAHLSTHDNLIQVDADKLQDLVSAIKSFPLRINGYMGYEKAQVTRGGIPFNEVTDHLESILHTGLYFAGEILDVDGTCGGYNLQWAFSSGNVSGKAAAEYIRKNKET